MPLHIIIDGYNFIHQSNKLINLVNSGLYKPNTGEPDLRDLREALIKFFSPYASKRKHKITIVFDGTNAPDFVDNNLRDKNINIIFSNKGQLADDVIKKMASSDKTNALIVTSDRDIINFVESVGSSAVSCPEFENKMIMSLSHEKIDDSINDNENSCGWIPTTKKKGPKRRLAKKHKSKKLKLNKI